MVVYVQNRGPSPKGDEDEEAAEAPTTIEVPERIEDGLMTPTSSVEQTSAPLTTPIDTMSRSLQSNFSIPDTLSFEGRHGRAYYATPPHYADTFSQPMLSTPVSAEMISPHDVSVFDYSSQNPFPTSTPDQQRTAPGQYDPWSTPSFRQALFSPVDYSGPPSSQGLPPPPMSYHMPMASHTQLHDMSHHNQSPDSMGQRALPFRTGSIGHPHGLPLSHLV